MISFDKPPEGYYQAMNSQGNIFLIVRLEISWNSRTGSLNWSVIALNTILEN